MGVFKRINIHLPQNVIPLRQDIILEKSSAVPKCIVQQLQSAKVNWMAMQFLGFHSLLLQKVRYFQLVYEFVKSYCAFPARSCLPVIRPLLIHITAAIQSVIPDKCAGGQCAQTVMWQRDLYRPQTAGMKNFIYISTQFLVANKTIYVDCPVLGSF